MKKVIFVLVTVTALIALGVAYSWHQTREDENAVRTEIQRTLSSKIGIGDDHSKVEAVLSQLGWKWDYGPYAYEVRTSVRSTNGHDVPILIQVRLDKEERVSRLDVRVFPNMP